MRFKKYLNESEKEFWDKIYKDGEDHWVDKNPSNLTKQVINTFKEFDNVLEIGCAAGIDTFLLAQHTKNKIIGIDIADKAIEIAKENLKKQDKKIQNKIIFETGDAEKLKYKDNQFDFLYSLSVLHSTDIKKSLAEVNRVLSDNSSAVIYVYIGKGKEEIDKSLFVDTCKKYFSITKEKEINLKDSDGDKHKAMIVFLEKGDK